MSKAHICQYALRVRLDICTDIVSIEKGFLEWFNGKIKCHRPRIDCRLNNTLNIEGNSKDRLLETPCHNIFSKPFMIKDELVFLNADIGTDLRIFRH